MKLMTKAIEKAARAQFPKGPNMVDQKAVARYFYPLGSWTMYLLNQDPENLDFLWGIGKTNKIRVRNFSFHELTNYRSNFRQKIERDLFFEPCLATEVWEDLMAEMKEEGKKSFIHYAMKEFKEKVKDIIGHISDKYTYEMDGTIYLVNNDLLTGESPYPIEFWIMKNHQKKEPYSIICYCPHNIFGGEEIGYGGPVKNINEILQYVDEVINQP